MKISFSTPMGNLNDRQNGYGTAGFGLVTTLQNLGHQVPFKDFEAPVQLNFCQPHLAEWGNNHNILYCPWESTEVPDSWLECFKEADELWATSEFVKDVYESYGLKVDNVFHHGIDNSWKQAEKRTADRKIKFLHIGAPAPRKGGQIALDAFVKAFEKQNDVSLTIKSYGRTLVYSPGHGNGRISPDHIYSNVNINRRQMEIEELIKFHYDYDVLIYPSWGEGFGLIPLQAMCTGMPVISTDAWASYKEEIIPELRVGSRLAKSPWPNIHPGQMFKPDFNDLVEKLRYTYDHFDSVSQDAYNRASGIHDRYDWNDLTSKSFSKIVQKFGP